MRSSRSAHAIVATALAALTFTADRASRAQAADPFAVMNRPRVELLLAAATREDADAFEGTLRELLARIGVDLATTRTAHVDDRTPLMAPGASTTSRAYVAVDLAAEEGVRGAVVDGETRGLVLRRTIRRDGSVAIAGEEMAHVVYSTIDALLDSARKPPEPPPAPPPITPPAAEAPRDAVTPQGPAKPGVGPALDVTAFGTMRYVGTTLSPAPGGGLGIGVAPWRARWAPELWLTGALQAPFDTASPVASVRTTMTSVRLLGTFVLLEGGRFRLDFGLGGGVDVAFVSSRSLDPSTKPSADQTRPSVPLTALAGLAFRVAPRIDITLAGGTDLDVSPVRYTVRHGDQTSELFESPRLRPFALLGLTFRPLGDARVAGGAR